MPPSRSPPSVSQRWVGGRWFGVLRLIVVGCCWFWFGFFFGGGFVVFFFSRFLTASFLGVVFFHVSSQPLTPEISGEGKCLKFRNSMQCLWACPAGPRRAPQREKPGRATAITRAG